MLHVHHHLVFIHWHVNHVLYIDGESNNAYDDAATPFTQTATALHKRALMHWVGKSLGAVGSARLAIFVELLQGDVRN